MDDTYFKIEVLFEIFPDLLCIAGYDGYFKKVNPAVSNLLGYTMEELYAKPIHNFIYQHDKEITAKVRTELTKSKPLLNFENRYVTKHGEIVWLSWTSLPVDSDQLIFAIAKNVTDKKSQETERNALLADLTKVNKELKQLNYTTSHDLRSPVNNLISIVSLIDVAKIGDEETIELLEYLKIAANQLKQSMNNYIDVLSEKLSVQVNVEEVGLDECLSDVLRSISSLIQTSEATVRTDFSKLKKIRFNEIYLKSIFLNLITNSIKYARPGYPPVISIESSIVNGVGQLVLADNGLGFDMEKVKNNIFGLHQQFHNHTDSKGIGLYLVNSHVTSLGGKIHVESKLNEGTKFVIKFND